ncbi:MAG: hypothetical protein HPM95_10830 [Alphaproteobacteria bacterium]|nr:hypothetical protein [Alphaproteobacteria bacterium]
MKQRAALLAVCAFQKRDELAKGLLKSFREIVVALRVPRLFVFIQRLPQSPINPSCSTSRVASGTESSRRTVSDVHGSVARREMQHTGSLRQSLVGKRAVVGIRFIGCFLRFARRAALSPKLIPYTRQFGVDRLRAFFPEFLRQIGPRDLELQIRRSTGETIFVPIGPDRPVRI